MIDRPPADEAAQRFDRLRRARNRDRYQAKPVGAASADQAEQVAGELFDAVIASEVWSAPAHPVQHAAAWAFTEPDCLRERVRLSRLLHGRVARAVADAFRAAGASVSSPTAGFYVYPDFEPHRESLRPGVLALGC